MAFGVVMRLAWQFYFFLRTDLFFLATTVLGCNDLQGASRQYLSNRVKMSAAAAGPVCIHGRLDRP